MKCQKLESQFYNSIKWGDFHTWNRKLVGGDTYEKIKKEIKFFFQVLRFMAHSRTFLAFTLAVHLNYVMGTINGTTSLTKFSG